VDGAEVLVIEQVDAEGRESETVVPANRSNQLNHRRDILLISIEVN